MRAIWPAACMLLFAMLFAHAQEGALPPDEEGAQFAFALGLGIGVVSFDDVTYQKVALSPDFSIGKWGIAFDLTLHYQFQDSELKIREEDWVPDPATFQEALGLYLSKFRYIRYGRKGDPLYAKFGSIDDGTLGNGFVMGQYANTLFLPERRIFGLSFDIDGAVVDFPYVGLETHVGDLSTLDVFGTRLYVRPLAGTDLPLLPNLQLGGTFASDIDPYRYAESDEKTAADLAGIDYKDATVYVIGADFRQPLLLEDPFTLAVFGDAVTQKLSSYGAMVGFGGRIVQFLTYGAQLRFIGDDFVPVYFDQIYDITRVERYALTEGAASTPGYIGWFASLGASLLGDTLVFRVSAEDSFGTVDDNEDNYLNYPRVRGDLIVGEGVLPGFSFDASYDKLLIREWDDFLRAEGAVAKARLNYRSGPALISFFYQFRFTDGFSDPEVTSGLETLITVN